MAFRISVRRAFVGVPGFPEDTAALRPRLINDLCVVEVEGMAGLACVLEVLRASVGALDGQTVPVDARLHSPLCLPDEEAGAVSARVVVH